MTDLERTLIQSLRFESEARRFGLRPGRERDLARHFYLLALEEVERGLEEQARTSPHHAV